MKKSLLATVAAVAFIAGTGVVAAESAKDHAGAAQSSHSQMNKGAEAKGHETTGSAAKDEMKSEPKADMKSGEKSKNKAESKPSKTTGSGANEMKSGANEKSGAENKNKANNKAEMNKNKSSTTGAGPTDEKAGTNTKANKADEKKAGENKAGENKAGENRAGENRAGEKKAGENKAGEKAGSSTTGANEMKSGTQSAQGSAGARGGSVNLTSEQKTKIRTTVLESRSAPKVSRSSINFDIRVGTAVPRSVHFVTVPNTIVEIHPAWRGYSYFVVDEEIVIIDPHTLQIVAVLNV